MKIAIVGGTGLVGREIIKILLERQVVGAKDLTLFASKNSAGKIVELCKNEFCVQELCAKNMSRFDYVFFCAGKDVSKQHAEHFIKKGAVVVDNSSFFRRMKNVPLVVPEVNFDLVKKNKLIANPNCTTIGLSLPIYYLSKMCKIKRIVVSTYQAVSGAGQKGVEDLKNNTKIKIEQGIKNNIVPRIDKLLSNGDTFEEDKVRFELKKIMCDRYLKVCATCVRVPVENCHCASVNIEFEKAVCIKEIKSALKQKEGVVVLDGAIPMPQIANGKDEVYVGRIRRDISNNRAINMFICFDNLRKGAALNAVMIVERLIKTQ